jgi:hypothetical protein
MTGLVRNDSWFVIARNEAIQGPWIATAFGLAMTGLARNDKAGSQ